MRTKSKRPPRGSGGRSHSSSSGRQSEAYSTGHIAEAEANRNCRAFAFLPNSAALDRNLTAPELVLLAYRLTFAGGYALNEKRLLREIAAGQFVKANGCGRNVLRRTIVALARRGYTARNQSHRGLDGTWTFARETLTHKAVATRADGQHVKRAWFDGRWALKEVGVFLFLRAHKAGSIAEIAARFGWHRETTAKIVANLVTAGHLAEAVRDGYRGRVFDAVSPRQDVEKPGNGDATFRGNGDVEKPGNTRTLRGKSHEAYGVMHAPYGVATAGLGRDDGLPRSSTARGLGRRAADKRLRRSVLRSLLAELCRADAARVLAPCLRKDARGLGAFLVEHGLDALEAVRVVLARATIDGKPVGSVRTWGYFSAAIAQAQLHDEMGEFGLRPGDIFCAHKFMVQESDHAH